MCSMGSKQLSFDNSAINIDYDQTQPESGLYNEDTMLNHSIFNNNLNHLHPRISELNSYPCVTDKID